MGEIVPGQVASATRGSRKPEVSVVLPCLNEAETLGACIRQIRETFRQAALDGEIVVADNGSTDGSQAIAESMGARVVPVPRKGYGSALRPASRRRAADYVIMGDADDSYDFATSGPFVAKLREGDDLVMGNRFRGGIQPGAMPWQHRYLGNPVLTGIGNLFFHSPIGDFHCGLRGFRKEPIERSSCAPPAWSSPARWW